MFPAIVRREGLVGNPIRVRRKLEMRLECMGLKKGNH